MRKRFSAKLMSLFLVLALLVVPVLAACDNEEGKKGSELLPDAYDTPIELTFSIQSYVQYIPLLNDKGWTLESNDMIDEYYDKLNIKLKLDINIDDIGKYFEILRTNLAAGKISDIVMMGDKYYGFPAMAIAEKEGLLADLTNVLDEYASDELKSLWDRAGEEIFYPGTFEGKIKAIPWVIDGRTSQKNVFYYRQDWLENVGGKVPTDIQGFAEMLDAFTNKDPNNSGQKDTLGLLFGDLYFDDFPLLDMFGAYPNYWLEDENGKLVYGATQTEGIKEFLSTMRSWYQNGYLNDNFDQGYVYHYMGQDFAKGMAGVIYGSSSVNFVNSLKKSNPDAKVGAFAPFSANGGELVLKSDANAQIWHCVSATNPYPEAAVKMLNLYYDYLTDESKYEEFFAPLVKADGSEDYPLAQFAVVKTNDINPEGTVKLINAIRAEDPSELNDAQKVTYDKYMEAVANPDKYALYSNIVTFGKGGSMDVYLGLTETATFMTNKFFTVNTPTMNESMESLLTDAYAAFALIIRGEQDVDYYDTYVDTFNSGAGVTITEEVNAWYDTVKTK